MIKKTPNNNTDDRNFQIPLYIYNLDIDDVLSNLFHYNYKLRYLSSIKDVNSDEYINAYNGFKGELYENIIYELLLKYAKEHKAITKFILKGPHQDNSKDTNKKTGLLIDKSNQIVYRAGYKDISEFDGLFFTKDSVYFMESTIVQDTNSLRKRLQKKYALMKIVFPNLQIKALIILLEGAMGVSKFPPYATIWQTKDLNADRVLKKLLSSYKKVPIISPKSENYDYASNVEVYPFKYFNVLQWFLNNSIKKSNLNRYFLLTYKNKLHFHIFKKVYIGYTTLDIIKKAHFDFDFDTKLDVYVSLEKLDNGFFDIFYYTKEKEHTKLIKIDLNKGDKAIFTKKDYKGFTTSEIKFIQYIIKKRHFIGLELLKTILQDAKKLPIIL